MVKPGSPYLKLIIVLLVLLGIGILVSTYWFKIVPSRENELNQRGFRILARLEKNLLDKKSNYLITLDEVNSKLFSVNSFRQRIKNNLTGLTFPKQYWVKELGKKQSILYYDSRKEKWEIRFYGDLYNLNNKKQFVDTQKGVEYTFDFEAFVEPILYYRTDFFEDFIIFKDSQLVYQTNRLAYTINPVQDSLFKTNIIQSGKVLTQNLSGKNYKVFYYPFKNTSELNLTLCGIVSEQKYNQKKFLLDNYETLHIILVVLLLALLLPFIKVFTITKYDRLYKVDIVYIILCLFGISTIVSIFLLSHIVDTGVNDWNKKTLKDISENIGKNFRNELNINLTNLYKLEDLQANKQFENWFINNLNSPYSVEWKKIEPVITNNYSRYVKNLIFIDTTGTARIAWLNDKDSLPPVSVNTRKYFSDIISAISTGYQIHDSIRDKISFQPVYSYEDQEYSVFLGKKPDSAFSAFINKIIRNSSIRQDPNRLVEVIALGTKMFSVMNPVVYEETGFCIINRYGETYFHSDYKRNLKENFLEECDQDPKLISAIINRNQEYLNLQFYGDKYKAYISPIENTPLYLVTFMNKSYRKDIIADILVFAIVLSSGIILLLLFMVVTQYVITSRPGLLRKKRWDFDFLNYNHTNLKIAKSILFILLTNGLLFIAGSFFMIGFDLIFFAWLMPLNIPLIGNLLVFLHLKRDSKISQVPFRDKILRKNFVFHWICTIVIASIFIIYLLTLNNAEEVFNAAHSRFFILSFIYLALIVTGFLILLKKKNSDASDWRKSIKHSALEKRPRRKQITYFSFIAILAVTNISIIPGTIFLYEASRCETYFTYKRRSLHIAQQLVKRTNHLLLPLHANAQFIKNKQDSILTSGVYYPGWNIRLNQPKPIADTCDLIACNNKLKYSFPYYNKCLIFPRTAFNKFYISIVNKTRVNYEDYEIAKTYLDRKASSDSSWVWTVYPDSESIHFFYQDPTVNSFVKHKAGIAISTSTPDLLIFTDNWKEQSFFILMLMLSLLLIFFIIKFIYKKITLVEYFSRLRITTSNPAPILSVIGTSADNFMIISVPGSGVNEQIDVQLTKSGYEKVDYEDRPLQRVDYFGSQSNTFPNKVIVLHYGIHEFNDLFIQLAEIEKEVFSGHTQVVVIAASDPIRSLLHTDQVALHNGENKISYPHFHLLNKFNKVYYPLHKTHFTQIKPIKEFEYTSRLIINEMKHGYTLQSISQLLLQYIEQSLDGIKNEKELFQKYPNFNEEVVLKIQDLSYNYYLLIWQQLSDEEKFVLYDMASDNMTNYHNLMTIFFLMKKGIIIYWRKDNCIKIFNKSFRNFILSVLKPTDAKALERKIKIKSTWKNIKTIVTVFLLIVGIIIYLTQENFFQKITGMVMAFSSILPMLSGLVGGIKEKK